MLEIPLCQAFSNFQLIQFRYVFQKECVKFIQYNFGVFVVKGVFYLLPKSIKILEFGNK